MAKAKKTSKSKSVAVKKTSSVHKHLLYGVPAAAGATAWIFAGLAVGVSVFGAALAANWYLHNKHKSS